MQLIEYPKQIAELENELITVRQKIETAYSDLKKISDAYELEIEFDEQLKNVQQRKAKKAYYLQSSDVYQYHNYLLTTESLKRDHLIVQIDMLKRELSIAILLKEEEIIK